MPTSLPKITTYFGHLTLAELASSAQTIINGLIAAAVAFPTPPISVVDLQSLLNTYNTARIAAINRGEKEVRAQDAAKINLMNALRTDANYVNTVAWASVQAGESYSTVSATLATSGYRLALDPSPVGILPQPVIKKFSSPNPGTLAVLISPAIHGAKSYFGQMFIDGMSAPITKTFPNTRIVWNGLTPGWNTHSNFCAIGANTEARNFSIQIDQIIT